ncbi:MAG: AbrB/MazE/SpoVT family DNA-binding domain-containing protein [Syntrophomonadaceae bacterium]|nr:AbrB/MazE/SpoVT family DNA-binding domain-containing protein [Syntrophomonadaceae bacterium]MDD3889874.1 AbrB/MazE/SpoVT family DNA-binding domain-containing protein [Syntrophomonadaceae bacterium]MDD4549923.1 AbrB/MazE/SpoVT family DNA-binding domain-containing protein [Syntrophomonadaceae bacterium]
MITLKLRKIGNSLGVILPKDVIERLYLKENDMVHLIEEPEGVHLTPYDSEFADWAEAFRKTNHKYRNVLRELGK